MHFRPNFKSATINGFEKNLSLTLWEEHKMFVSVFENRALRKYFELWGRKER
jgi:hypothetical protein